MAGGNHLIAPSVSTRFIQNRSVLTCSLGLLAIIGICLLGPLFLHYGYDEADLNLGPTPPSLTGGHVLGTDQLGRDVLARLLYGGRISLFVAMISTMVSLIIGMPYGAVAGYMGGRVDNVMMRIVDILYSLPYMFLVIMLMALFGDPALADPVIEFLHLDREGGMASWLRGPGLRMLLLFIALGAVSWLTTARIVRGQVLSLKNMAFVEAARALGLSQRAILWRHVIPNTFGVVIVYATLTIPAVILQEAFLSFLGLGIQPPQATWGTLIHDGVQMMDVAPWLLIFPGLTLAVTLFLLNLLGDGLRDALDVTN
jgi:oligopeptide transport system permease protein